MKLLVQVVASLLFVMTVVGQNLVLIGGNLRDDNTDVWNRIIELAVSTRPFLCPFLFLQKNTGILNVRSLYSSREVKVQLKSESSRLRDSAQWKETK